jgi:RNA polymerase sigma-70 factor, ECF subfamily
MPEHSLEIAQALETHAQDAFTRGEDTFAGLVKKHQSMVFSMAYAFLRDRSAAEEVAQDVFFELHRSLASLDSPAHVVNWLRRVTAHRSIDRQRRLRPLWALDDVREPAAPVPQGDPMLAEALRQLIATLPDKPRLVMILRYQEDMDAGEIGEVLDMPLGTVKSHLQRSLKLLREKFSRRYGEVSL